MLYLLSVARSARSLDVCLSPGLSVGYISCVLLWTLRVDVLISFGGRIQMRILACLIAIGYTRMKRRQIVRMLTRILKGVLHP